MSRRSAGARLTRKIPISNHSTHLYTMHELNVRPRENTNIAFWFGTSRCPLDTIIIITLIHKPYPLLH